MKFPRPAAFLLLAPAMAWAQEPAPSGAKDAIKNGGFESTLQAPNLWTGVDKDGFLAGFRGSLPALNPSGSIAETPMPVGVAVGDLNGDGLPDILSSDPLGYVRIYFNSGSKEQPKFTTGELTLPWLASGEGAPPWLLPELNPGEHLDRNLKWAKRRQGVRVSLVDLTGSGKLDLVAGNYFGDIFVVRNSGTAQRPQFPQPPSVAKAATPTMKDPLHRWGNIFAPVMHDWDGDKRPDLLVGEGSYSANNIHLFLNQGSAAAPVFSEEKRRPLALGEGRQQLTPALADVNGDGKMDILVADGEGRVTAYVRPAAWKFGDSISPTGFLSKSGGLAPDKGQALALGPGIHTIATGDMNGDGLFDLVIGKNNGRIAWAANKGTKEAPKFEVPADLTGDKPVPAVWELPSQWEVDAGASRGNFLVYANSVTAQDDPGAQPVEGTRALKFGYTSPAGSVLPSPRLVLPATEQFDRLGEQGDGRALLFANTQQRGTGAPANFFILRQPVQMEIGKTYKLSFQTKGNKVANASCIVVWRGFKQLGEDRLVRGERGAVRIERNRITEWDRASSDFRPSGTWSTVSKDFKIVFKKERELNKEKLTLEAVVEISFELTDADGFLYLDDLKLVPQG